MSDDLYAYMMYFMCGLCQCSQYIIINVLIEIDNEGCMNIYC